MKWLKPILNMVFPTILFYVIYKYIGIIPAVTVAAGYSAISMTIDTINNKKVQNSQIAGVVGLIGAAAMIILTGEEKYYYLPALIENAVFLIFMLVLTVQKKSVLHFLGKDFEIQALEEVPENHMLPVNLLWIAYFAVKIISKAAGMLFLDFEKLYWLVFILGDPMTIAVVIISIVIIRRQYTGNECTGEHIDDNENDKEECKVG